MGNGVFGPLNIVIETVSVHVTFLSQKKGESVLPWDERLVGVLTPINAR